MKQRCFGSLPTGERVTEYTITNGKFSARVLDYGAILRSLTVFGRDVVGGFDRIEDYLADDSHQGGTVGRIANRIGGACFTLDGVEYKVTANSGKNCLHGGERGFDRRMWKLVGYDGEDTVSFCYSSADGEEGFPGRLDVSVQYKLTDNGLLISYGGYAHDRTVASLTNHAYFNLDGFGGDILSHRVAIFADEYTAVDGELIPTGEHKSVKGTPLDFTVAKPIGEAIEAIGGVDHNFILSGKDFIMPEASALRLAATVENGDIRLTMYTDRPCVQVYTGNFLGGGPDFKGGTKQVKHGALCLEAQTEPNGVKHGQDILGKGEAYMQTTLYAFEKI